MESVSKITIFGLKMMMKSGLEKIFLKFLHAGDYFPLLHKSAQNHKFSNKNNHLPAWRDFKIIFSRPLFTTISRPKNGIFGYRFRFEGKSNVWFSQIWCAKESWWFVKCQDLATITNFPPCSRNWVARDMNYPIPFWLLVEPNTPVNFVSYSYGVIRSNNPCCSYEKLLD